MKIKIQESFDFILMLAVMVLSVLGILFVYSAGFDSNGVLTSNFYKKQIVWCIFGFLLMVVTALVDYRSLMRYVPYLYIGLVATLFLLLLLPAHKNVHSWVKLGSVYLQPAEMGKIVYIMFLAWYLERSKNKSPLVRFVTATASFSVPVLLILKQPDLGTASVYIPILLIMCLMAGIPVRYLMILLLTGIITVVFTILPSWYKEIWQKLNPTKIIPAISVLTNLKLIIVLVLAFLSVAIISALGYIFLKKRFFYWIAYITAIVALSLLVSYKARDFLDDYQKKRLITFLAPELDKQGSGWHIWQSLIAIGSGKFGGRGYLAGKQSQLQYLPEQHTDFIFSILAEESGFVGGILVFFLFTVIFLRIIRVMQNTRNNYGFYIVSGILGMFIFHFIVNVGMVMSVMPITGIPLPFLSYGGSGYMTFSVAIGLVMSVRSRRMDFSTITGNSRNLSF